MLCSFSIENQVERLSRNIKETNIILSSLTFFETIQLQNVIRGFNDVKNLQNRM